MGNNLMRPKSMTVPGQPRQGAALKKGGMPPKSPFRPQAKKQSGAKKGGRGC